MQKVHNHGDVILLPSDITPPKGIKPAKVVVLQDSGPTGNRHEVAGEVIYWKDGDKEYVHVIGSVLRHVGGDSEHGEQVLEDGTYVREYEEEYDPFKNELRVVID